MPLKIETLNIEGDRHLNKVWPHLEEILPDILCLQEVFEADLKLFIEKFGGSIYFVPNSIFTQDNHMEHSPRGSWGIAIWIRAGIAHQEPKSTYYRGSRELLPESKLPGLSCRAVIVLELTHEAKEYTVANIHFTWTPDGEADDRQRSDFRRLMTILKQYPTLLLCGDFNAPRGGEIFAAFCQNFTDNVPPEVVSTLDPILHRQGAKLELVVDNIFSRGPYRVENVIVHQGISDHKAITAVVSLPA